MIQIISTNEFVFEPFRGDQFTDLYKIFGTKIDPLNKEMILAQLHFFLVV